MFSSAVLVNSQECTFPLVLWVLPIHHWLVHSRGTALPWLYDPRCFLPAALLLCILSAKDLYKMGLLWVLFNFSMGLCLSKLHANSLRKRNARKLLLGKGDKDLLYTLALMLITPPFKSQMNRKPTIAWEIHRACNQSVGYFSQNVAFPCLFNSFGEDW